MRKEMMRGVDVVVVVGDLMLTPSTAAAAAAPGATWSSWPSPAPVEAPCHDGAALDDDDDAT